MSGSKTTEALKRDYERERNWRVAQAFDIDVDLVDAVCADDDGESWISDYDTRETIIVAGRMIREKFTVLDLLRIVEAAYVEVTGIDGNGTETEPGD